MIIDFALNCQATVVFSNLNYKQLMNRDSYMEQITPIVDKFSPITLAEMDAVKLMNRIDTKYIVSANRLVDLLEEAKEKYRILEIDGCRELLYRTTYFDTKDSKMYNAHQNGKLNRYKIRTREYVVSGIHFLEVKFKNNKGRTVKNRVKRSEGALSFKDSEAGFLEEASPFSVDDLRPKLWNKFIRLTLVHHQAQERITIDFNLSFNNEEGKELVLPKLSIIEVKQAKYTADSDFLQILKKNGIYEKRISKYCVGSALLYPELKHNRFKEKLMIIDKLK